MSTIIQPSGASFDVSSPTMEDLELLPMTGLQGVWEFKEGTGTSVADLSGISGAATITPGAGAWGLGGFVLDGSASWIRLPISALANFSWAIVFKPDDSGNIAQGVVMSTSGAYTSFGDTLLWQRTNGQLFRQKVSDTAGGTNNSLAMTSGLHPTGIWTPALASAAGVSYDVQKLDTGQSAVGTVSGAAVPGTSFVSIGRNATSVGPGFSYFKGTIGYVIAWSRQLSGTVTKAGVPSERQKVMTWLRAKMAAKSVAI